VSEALHADGVFSGGGVKAIAYAGALKAAEEAGYTEWEHVAGTSAGAITAAAIAVGLTADELTEQLMKFDLETVADIGRPRRLALTRNLVGRQALARGRALRAWIAQLLEGARRPARTFADLDGRLRVVATDLVHKRMVVFPRDAARYLDRSGRPWEPEAFPVADAVRMSAGYPFMFPPVRLRDATSGTLGALVDGGIVSSFPVFLFDRNEPCHPTWGFRLEEAPETPKSTISGLRWPLNMMLAIVESSINELDDMAADAFSQRTVVIPTGTVTALQFRLQETEKRALWQAGYDAAARFFASNPSARNIFGSTPPPDTLPASSPAAQPAADSAEV
jgi:NTE family protein